MDRPSRIGGASFPCFLRTYRRAPTDCSLHCLQSAPRGRLPTPDLLTPEMRESEKARKHELLSSYFNPNSFSPISTIHPDSAA